MSIVDSSHSNRNLRIARLQGLTGVALLSAAVFSAAPKVARGDWAYIGTGDGQSWFSTANWACATLTGSLPDLLTNPTGNIDANNVSMPSVGVLFDPANQINNANYIANFDRRSTSFYVSSASGNPPGSASQPNKLTIESGTMNMFLVSLGRDGQGTVVLNGGAWIGNAALQDGGGNKSGMGTGTFEYHGGNFTQINSTRLGTAQTTNDPGSRSAATGVFIVYNDGPDGAIINANGMQISVNSQSGGSVGIVEFHYDLNTHGVGNTRPIQNVAFDGVNNGALSIRNTTGVLFTSKTDGSTCWQSGMSSRLNLVLDAAPSVINGSVQNLGLFKESDSILGQGTWPKIFYSMDGSIGYSQGATITARVDSTGPTYSWTISYSGLITFTDSSTSAYSPTNVAGAGGTDVVLIGLPTAVVPEPGTLALLAGAGSLIMARRRKARA